MTGICPDKSLPVGDHVFGTGFLLAQSHFPLHSSLVSSQKGDVVSLDQKLRDLQLAVGRSLKSVLRFRPDGQRIGC